jgi:hypothetical protein
MKKYLILFFISFFAINVMAQDPNWSVNPANYQYSMTFTAFLNVNGTTLSSAEDKVAAIVNGEVRGVANVTYVASVDKYVVYLSVFANTAGETISFQIFNNADQNVYTVLEEPNFVIDGNIGGIFQSYSIASPALSNETVLNSFSFVGVTSVSQTISSNAIDIVLPANTDLTNLVAEFNISNGARFFIDNVNQISGTSINDFTDAVYYKLLSENEDELVEYDVNVTIVNINIDTPELFLTSNVNAFVKQAPVLINMETNVPISNLEAEDILLLNALVLSITKENDFLYKLKIVPIQQGDFSIEIPENKVINTENEGNLASNKLTFIYDLVSPYIVSIKRKNPAVEITESTILEFTVHFSEDVENVLSNSFESIFDAVFTVVKENDSTYKVTVSNIDGYVGALSLKLKPTNTIKDKAGNLLLNSVINVHQN